jgi:hypothetical protein
MSGEKFVRQQTHDDIVAPLATNEHSLAFAALLYKPHAK